MVGVKISKTWDGLLEASQALDANSQPDFVQSDSAEKISLACQCQDWTKSRQLFASLAGDSSCNLVQDVSQEDRKYD